MLEYDPATQREASKLFTTVLESVSEGKPVIVHQYWGKRVPEDIIE